MPRLLIVSPLPSKMMVDHRVITAGPGPNCKSSQIIKRSPPPCSALHPLLRPWEATDHLPYLTYLDPFRYSFCSHSSSYFQEAFTEPNHPTQRYCLFHLFLFEVHFF
jgi:hypothetical protein